jgi:hypothetical protein
VHSQYRLYLSVRLGHRIRTHSCVSARALTPQARASGRIAKSFMLRYDRDDRINRESVLPLEYGRRLRRQRDREYEVG